MKTEGKRNADNSQKRSVHGVFGVFLSLNGLLFILCEREKFYYFLFIILFAPTIYCLLEKFMNVFNISFCHTIADKTGVLAQTLKLKAV